MLNIQFLTKSLLVSSFLVSLSPANAMFGNEGKEVVPSTSKKITFSPNFQFYDKTKSNPGCYLPDEQDTLSISAKTLEEGYRLGRKGKTLKFYDGSEFLVTNKGDSEPDFWKLSPVYYGIVAGNYCPRLEVSSENNEFSFCYKQEDATVLDLLVTRILKSSPDHMSQRISGIDISLEDPLTLQKQKKNPTPSMVEKNIIYNEVENTLSLTARMLEKGYALGREGKTLKLQDGSELLITNLQPWTEPGFFRLRYNYYSSSAAYGIVMPEFDKFTAYGNANDEFIFNYEEPNIDVFKLCVKRFPKKQINETNIPPRHKEEAPLVNTDVSQVISRPTKSITIENNEEFIDVTHVISEPISKISQALPKEEEKENFNHNKYKIFNESPLPKNRAKKAFYTNYDEEKGLYYSQELLTEETSRWWLERIGYEAHMQFGTRENCGYGIYESEDVRKFLNLRSKPFYDGEYEALFNKQTSYPSGSFRDYLAAWRGFQHNLENYKENPTWVAYISSKPVEGPLCNSASVTSPDIKMAMTLKVSETFYTPLGIYNSPIAQAFDKDRPYKQLSMPFHSAVARFVQKIYPGVKEMIVRPLQSMAVIFEKMRLEFSKSSGYSQGINYPYVRYFISKTAEDMKNFGNSPFIIADSRTDEFHLISEDHWFSQSPFLGGADLQLIEAFPFFTVDVNSLSNR